MVVSSLLNGCYNAWGSVLPILFRNLGNSSGHNFDSNDGDMFSLSTSLGYAVGGYLIGELADRYYSTSLKGLLVTTIVMATLALSTFVLLIPPAFIPPVVANAMAFSGGQQYTFFIIMMALTGAFVGATMP